MSGDERSADYEEYRRRENEWTRKWKAANRDKVAAYNLKYREARRPELRKKRNEYYQRVEKDRLRRRRMRKAARLRRIAANPERERARERAARNRYVAKQKAADPEAFRKVIRDYGRASRAKNREKLNAQKWERYRRNPEPMRASTRAYIENNKEAIREQRRGYYLANRERILENNRRWKARERHRREDGLPPNRVKRTSHAEKLRNEADADAFFAKKRTRKEIQQLVHGGPTPPQLINWWNLQNARLRAAHGYVELSTKERLRNELAARRVQQQRERDEKAAIEAAENARIDAIARAHNDRLRANPRRQANRAEHPPAWNPDNTMSGPTL